MAAVLDARFDLLAVDDVPPPPPLSDLVPPLERGVASLVASVAVMLADLRFLGDGFPVEDKVARWQTLVPCFPWIAPGWRVWWRNPMKGRVQILQCSEAEP